MTTRNIKIQLVRKGPASVASNLEEVQTNLTDLNEGEVLVKVEACGVCYRDIIDREGGNSFLSTPIALGHEIAGVVQQSTVSEWKQGDRIVSLHGAPCRECKSCKEGNSPRCVVNAGYFYGLLCDGGYQKYAILHHKSLVPLPGSISFSEGSFLCCTAAVALRALRLASIKPGDKVLITGASGGVGVHAIQVVKGLGAKPICVTSSENKIAALKDLGAELVILSKENSFHREVIQELGGPVDIVLELVGGLTFRSSLASVKPTGTVVVVGNISVANVQIPLGRMILFELKVIGSSGATPEDLEEVIRMAENKVLKPQLWKEFPLSVEGVQAAHSLLKHKGVMGRVVLKSSL